VCKGLGYRKQEGWLGKCRSAGGPDISRTCKGMGLGRSSAIGLGLLFQGGVATKGGAVFDLRLRRLYWRTPPKSSCGLRVAMLRSTTSAGQAGCLCKPVGAASIIAIAAAAVRDCDSTCSWAAQWGKVLLS
jgi:hypothetical protein